ncbi:MAG TPA: hypothetical protein VJL89_03730 [Thermodesulfovibrionia bacterium]|nr:hypothetical protein [Thermodesulfovibrionia bacterium]
MKCQDFSIRMEGIQENKGKNSSPNPAASSASLLLNPPGLFASPIKPTAFPSKMKIAVDSALTW